MSEKYCNFTQKKILFLSNLFFNFNKGKKMARVTVEDCIDKIPNRYELLMVATQRAKDIASGSPIMVPADNDKNPVIALREIAEEKVDIEELQRALVMDLQKYVEVEEPEEEEMEIESAEKELSEMDEQFSSLLLDNEMSDAMQVRDGDEDIDLNADEGEADLDLDGEEDDLKFDDVADIDIDDADAYDED